MNNLKILLFVRLDYYRNHIIDVYPQKEKINKNNKLKKK
jgi:hypothetical protein